MPSPRRALALCALVLLTACDTYGVDGIANDPPPQSVWNEMLDAVNEARSQSRTCGGTPFAAAPPLHWDDRLEAAARAHTEDMARNDHFDHVGTDGSEPGDRVRRAGYGWRRVGENIARHQRSVDEVVSDWLDSAGHCQQLMDPRFVEMGAVERDGYWTQVFGAPR